METIYGGLWMKLKWGGPHTCMNMSMSQDYEKLDSDLIVTCVVGMFFMFILFYFMLFVI